MKKSLLSIAVIFAMASSLFARGTYPLETVELCFAFGIEDYLNENLPNGYSIVKMHRSDIGETSLNQEYIRDIQIIQMIDGKEIQVCYMFPYYEDNEPKDFPVKFPVKMVLDNTNNDFEKSSKQTVSICFAIDIEDAAFLDYMFQHFVYDECLEYINKRINKGSYIDYYKIKDKIKFDHMD